MCEPSAEEVLEELSDIDNSHDLCSSSASPPKVLTSAVLTGENSHLDDSKLLVDLEQVLVTNGRPIRCSNQNSEVKQELTCNPFAEAQEKTAEAGDKPIIAVEVPVLTVNGTAQDILAGNTDAMSRLYEKYNRQCAELERFDKQNQDLKDELLACHKDKDSIVAQFQDFKTKQNAKQTEMERKFLEFEYQLKAARDRYAAQENHYKHTISDLCTKHTSQIDQLKKSTDSAQREKDTAVIKYASREKEVLDLQTNLHRLTTSNHQLVTERDALTSRLRGAKNDKDALIKSLDQKTLEVGELQREIDRIKTYYSEADARIKAANKRVEDVEEAHKETRSELEKTQKRLKEAKEETETIRANCQQMIKQYQESEEFRSNSLDKQLKERDMRMRVQEREKTDKEEIYKTVAEELDALKKQHKQTLRDLEDLKAQLRSSEQELANEERKLIDANDLLAVQKRRNEDLEKLVASLRIVEQTLEKQESVVRDLEAEIADLREHNEDLKRDAENCRMTTERNLEMNQKLTDSAMRLQAENNSKLTRVTELEAQNNDYYQEITQLQSKLRLLENDYDQLKTHSAAEIKQIQRQNDELSLKAKEFQTAAEDEQNKSKILQKKHVASVKELKSELQLMKKRLDAFESGTASQGSGGSVAGADEYSASSSCQGHGANPRNISRTPSQSSLREAALHPGHAQSNGVLSTQISTASLGKTAKSSAAGSPTTAHAPFPALSAGGAAVEFYQNNACATPQVAALPQLCHISASGQVMCEHNQTMIEKIVKLQRSLARRTEKIEFLEEHVRQLIGELQKKSRIIQNYALREESGALVPSNADVNKAELTRKGQTVMGSLFSAGVASGVNSGKHSLLSFASLHEEPVLTLDLSLQINRKLQIVLEDTLLKNITLKDSMDTLGEEISRLSRENRQLKLKFGDHS